MEKKPPKKPQKIVFTSKIDISAVKRSIFKIPTPVRGALTHLQCDETVARVKKKKNYVFFGGFLKHPPLMLLPVWQPCLLIFSKFDCQVVHSVTAGVYCVKMKFLG